MCGRFSLSKRQLVEVAEFLDAVVAGEDAALYRPRYNVAPTDVHWIVRPGGARRELVPAVWGVASAREQLVINARSETAERTPMFREAFESRRCVVPADGFFEWTGPRVRRRPIWFHAPEGRLLLMAGLYELRPDGRMAFTILTTTANADVADVHDRMPALLAPACVAEWLEAPRAELLVPAPAGTLIANPVSSRVNSVENDDPACLDDAPDEPPEKQLRLL